jgi:hypothetical protein
VLDCFDEIVLVDTEFTSLPGERPLPERGIEICAPIHDAVLICAPTDQIEADVAAMRAAMAEASRAVLGGFELGTDVKIVRYPDRYIDPRGQVMWDRVHKLIRARTMRRTA